MCEKCDRENFNVVELRSPEDQSEEQWAPRVTVTNETRGFFSSDNDLFIDAWTRL